MQKTQLEPGDLACFAVRQQPVVGVPAIVPVEHDFHVLVDRAGVLHSLARAHKFRLAIGVPAVEIGDRRLSDHQAVRIYAEIVVTHDYAWKSVHQHAVALLRGDVEDNFPARAFQVTCPIVVRHHDLVILGVTAGGHESAAMLGTGFRRRLHTLRLFVQPGYVVVGQFHERIHGHDIVQIEFVVLRP